MRKAENSERDVFRVCSAESERMLLYFTNETEVLVKGVYFCFASETELGTRLEE